MSEPRKTSEVTDIRFPHGFETRVCYFELRGGEVNWTSGRDEIREAVLRALAGESVLYAAWPGMFQTHLFIVDDLKDAARALGVPTSPEEKAAMDEKRRQSALRGAATRKANREAKKKAAAADN